MEDNTASVVTEAFDIAQRYLTPSITEVEEPGTGVIGKAIIGASGVKELPESIFDAFREKPKRRIENATLFDHAFSESIEKAKEKTELPAFLGKYRG